VYLVDYEDEVGTPPLVCKLSLYETLSMPSVSASSNRTNDLCGSLQDAIGLWVSGAAYGLSALRLRRPKQPEDLRIKRPDALIPGTGLARSSFSVEVQGALTRAIERSIF
jgi:hypothetical protein